MMCAFELQELMSTYCYMLYNIDSKECNEDVANCGFVLFTCDWLFGSNYWVSTKRMADVLDIL